MQAKKVTVEIDDGSLTNANDNDKSKRKTAI